MPVECVNPNPEPNPDLAIGETLPGSMHDYHSRDGSREEFEACFVLLLCVFCQMQCVLLAGQPFVFDNVHVMPQPHLTLDGFVNYGTAR
jgi:hypothetical protein